MAAINAETPVEQVAALVSQALEAAGITATLSGGAAVTVYSANEYGSRDLDFVTSEALAAISAADSSRWVSIAVATTRGSSITRKVVRGVSTRPPSLWRNGVGPSGSAGAANRPWAATHCHPHAHHHGPLAYVHWKDGQSWDQAVIVAKRQHVNWPELEAWAQKEGVDPGHIQRLCEKAGKGEHDRGSGCGPSTA